MSPDLPTVVADLTWVQVNGGTSHARLSSWEAAAAPVPGMRVLAVDGSGALEAVITGVREDGIITLSFSNAGIGRPDKDAGAHEG